MCLFVTATRIQLRKIFCATNLLKAELQVNKFLMFLTTTWKNMKSADESMLMCVQMEPDQW
jgi:hypothetical protein